MRDGTDEGSNKFRLNDRKDEGDALTQPNTPSNLKIGKDIRRHDGFSHRGSCHLFRRKISGSVSFKL
jgi:hypothetical protein